MGGAFLLEILLRKSFAMRVKPRVSFHALGRDTVGLVVRQSLLCGIQRGSRKDRSDERTCSTS